MASSSARSASNLLVIDGKRSTLVEMAPFQQSRWFPKREYNPISKPAALLENTRPSWTYSKRKSVPGTLPKHVNNNAELSSSTTVSRAGKNSFSGL
jgi:hypothetical protein